MCLICVEFNKLTVLEARNNLCEMRENIGEVHAKEVENKIDQKAIEELEELLKDFDPFISPPKFSNAEQVDVETENLLHRAASLGIFDSADSGYIDMGYLIELDENYDPLELDGWVEYPDNDHD